MARFRLRFEVRMRLLLAKKFKACLEVSKLQLLQIRSTLHRVNYRKGFATALATSSISLVLKNATKWSFVSKSQHIACKVSDKTSARFSSLHRTLALAA